MLSASVLRRSDGWKARWAACVSFRACFYYPGIETFSSSASRCPLTEYPVRPLKLNVPDESTTRDHFLVSKTYLIGAIPLYPLLRSDHSAWIRTFGTYRPLIPRRRLSSMVVKHRGIEVAVGHDNGHPQHRSSCWRGLWPMRYKELPHSPCTEALHAGWNELIQTISRTDARNEIKVHTSHVWTWSSD